MNYEMKLLIQRRRDSRAALRLIRKLLKKQGFVPKLLITDKLRSYGSAFRHLRLTGTSKAFGKITGRRIRIRQCDDASASCNGSSQLDPSSVSLASTVRFTTPSTFYATSSLDPHCVSSEP